MRGVFRWLASIALAVALVALVVPSAYAEDEPSPFDPPQARIRPPSGVASTARIQPPTGVATEARISPPTGVATEARISPPSGDPEATLVELVRAWLEARIGVPLR
jgi:hypothetical protein